MVEKYYVYALIDPRDGKPFYVGKGKNRRMFKHVLEARGGRSGAKCDVIRAILAAGLDVQYDIIQRFECEDDAYSFEAQKIAEIGIGNLTNIAFGGRPFWEKSKDSAMLYLVRNLFGLLGRSRLTPNI